MKCEMDTLHITVSSGSDNELVICFGKNQDKVSLCRHVLYEEQEDFIKFNEFAILNNKAFESYMKKTYSEETYQKLCEAKRVLDEVYEKLTMLKAAL